MRLLICGDRHWKDKACIKQALESLSYPAGESLVIIHGAATGADTLAGEIAEELGIPVEVYPAQWKKFGKGAGPRRNQQMLEEGKPTHVWAFHEYLENSKGTRDMVTRAIGAGLPTTNYTGKLIILVTAVTR